MNAVLARILAFMDALLLPEPGETPDLGSMQNRRSQHVAVYHRLGIPWRPALLCPEETAKQAERILSSLVFKGLLTTPSRRRREHCRLTNYGHAKARLLIGWKATIDGAADVLVALQKARHRAAMWDGRPWLPITLDATVRAKVLFALGQDWLAADSDQYGVVLFSITEAGARMLKSGMVNDVHDKVDPALREIYEDAFQTSLQVIRELPILNHCDLHLILPSPSAAGGSSRPGPQRRQAGDDEDGAPAHESSGLRVRNRVSKPVTSKPQQEKTNER